MISAGAGIGCCSLDSAGSRGPYCSPRALPLGEVVARPRSFRRRRWQLFGHRGRWLSRPLKIRRRSAERTAFLECFRERRVAIHCRRPMTRHECRCVRIVIAKHFEHLCLGDVFVIPERIPDLRSPAVGRPHRRAAFHQSAGSLGVSGSGMKRHRPAGRRAGDDDTRGLSDLTPTAGWHAVRFQVNAGDLLARRRQS